MAFLTGLHLRSSTESGDPPKHSSTSTSTSTTTTPTSQYLNDIVNTMMGSSPSDKTTNHNNHTAATTKLLLEEQQLHQHHRHHPDEDDLEMSNGSKHYKSSGGGVGGVGGNLSNSTGGGGGSSKLVTLKAKDSNLSNTGGSTDHPPQHDGDSHAKHHAAFSAAHIKAISACGLYSFCSVSMILTNKSLASSYNHLIDGELNILLVVFQAVVAVLCVEFCKRMGWVEYPQVTLEVAKSWAPVNLFFCGMLFTGMASLASNSVPMVTVFKNVTNVATTAGDYFFFGNRAEPLVLAAFGVMLFGAIAAAWNDISVTSTGLFWMAANCITTSGYVLYMKHATQHVKLSKFGMVYVNNVLCVFFLLPAAMIMGEVTTFLTSDRIHTLAYFSKNFWAGFVGFFLNFASLNCVQATGPTTYAIVGSLNKIPVTFLGYIFFDSTISWETWCYISVSMCGGFLYSYAMIQSSRKDRQN